MGSNHSECLNECLSILTHISVFVLVVVAAVVNLEVIQGVWVLETHLFDRPECDCHEILATAIINELLDDLLYYDFDLILRHIFVHCLSDVGENFGNLLLRPLQILLKIGVVSNKNEGVSSN